MEYSQPILISVLDAKTHLNSGRPFFSPKSSFSTFLVNLSDPFFRRFQRPLAPFLTACRRIFPSISFLPWRHGRVLDYFSQLFLTLPETTFKMPFFFIPPPSSPSLPFLSPQLLVSMGGRNCPILTPSTKVPID